jgi:hypothetical protein
MSSQSIPLKPSNKVIDIKMLRQLGQWPENEDGILRLGHYEGNGRDTPVVKGAYVIGLGGIIPDVEVRAPPTVSKVSKYADTIIGSELSLSCCPFP